MRDNMVNILCIVNNGEVNIIPLTIIIILCVCIPKAVLYMESDRQACGQAAEARHG